MTAVKLLSQLRKRVVEALEPHAAQMYERREHWVALVEFEVHERIETTETDADGNEYLVETARLRVSSLEIATGDAEHHVREALRALWSRRTASGTLDEPLAGREAETAVRLLPGLIRTDDQ